MKGNDFIAQMISSCFFFKLGSSTLQCENQPSIDVSRIFVSWKKSDKVIWYAELLFGKHLKKKLSYTFPSSSLRCGYLDRQYFVVCHHSPTKEEIYIFDSNQQDVTANEGQLKIHLKINFIAQKQFSVRKLTQNEYQVDLGESFELRQLSLPWDIRLANNILYFNRYNGRSFSALLYLDLIAVKVIRLPMGLSLKLTLFNPESNSTLLVDSSGNLYEMKGDKITQKDLKDKWNFQMKFISPKNYWLHDRKIYFADPATGFVVYSAITLEKIEEIKLPDWCKRIDWVLEENNDDVELFLVREIDDIINPKGLYYAKVNKIEIKCGLFEWINMKSVLLSKKKLISSKKFESVHAVSHNVFLAKDSLDIHILNPKKGKQLISSDIIVANFPVSLDCKVYYKAVLDVSSGKFYDFNIGANLKC